MNTVNLDNIKLSAAISLKQAIDSGNVYLCIGKKTPWANEASPPTAKNNDVDNVSIKNNLLYMVKLNPSDCALAIPRKDYTSGIVYAPYSATSEVLADSNFYVTTASNNVYKCLSNNNGAISTVQPTGTSTASLVTADGYTWKFMYNLPSAYISKFANTQFFATPIMGDKTSQQILVENAAIEGNNTPVGGHGKDAASELKTKSVFIAKTVNLTSNPDLVALSKEFRQFCLIFQPKDQEGNLLTDSDYVLDISSTNGIIPNLELGYIMNINNHEVVDSDDDSQMIVQTIVQF